ncbi:rRNA maturation RNase YbeY [Candidatus Kaiserbacteria bacterium]|nr:rRNA maturation RNase YbeY [Candidatus Kaiserbacteria bacterium]
MSGVSVRNLTRRRLAAPRVVFSKITNEVLPDWEISLVFVGPKKALELNKKLRGKSYVPNVLSYVSGDKSGEIIICLSEAAKQASSFLLTPKAYCLYLFIHAALHIKGWAHGDKMDTCERKILSRYEKAHSYGNRHRHVPSKNGRRRGAVR